MKYQSTTIKSTVSYGVCVLALVGCGGSGHDSLGNEESVAETQVAITTVPTGVLCVKFVVTVGSQTVNPSAVTVAAGASSATLSLGQLPAGNATFNASAYNVACSSVTGSTVAAWIADPATATLAPGYVANVPMNFRQNYTATVRANFTVGAAEAVATVNSTYERMGDGSVMQWGSYGSGSSASPVPVPSLTGALEIAGGNGFACARKADGSVWCWGYNISGVLGPSLAIGATTASPIQISLSGPAQLIFAGSEHACALLSGSLYCWGRNTEGQLGNGTTTNSSTPILSRSNVGTAGCGYSHTCIADNGGGRVYCTGYNAYGQLGNGTTTSSTSYVGASLTGSAVAIAGGLYHTCVLLADTTVRCFGYNGSGALGDGTTGNRPSPVVVTGLSNVVQVQTGLTHSCALLQNNSVMCWGTASAIGTGQGSDQLTPVSVAGLTNVLNLSANTGGQTCVDLSDHTVKCWGANSYGQVGDGTFTYAPRPVTIQF